MDDSAVLATRGLRVSWLCLSFQWDLLRRLLQRHQSSLPLDLSLFFGSRWLLFEELNIVSVVWDSCAPNWCMCKTYYISAFGLLVSLLAIFCCLGKVWSRGNSYTLDERGFKKAEHAGNCNWRECCEVIKIRMCESNFKIRQLCSASLSFKRI